MGRVGSTDEHGVRGVLRPARQIGCAKIGGVELGSRDLGHGVDAAAAVGGGVPVLPSRQYLTLCEAGFLGDCQPRHAESYAARRDRRHELASRNSHCAAPFVARAASPAVEAMAVGRTAPVMVRGTRTSVRAPVTAMLGLTAVPPATWDPSLA